MECKQYSFDGGKLRDSTEPNYRKPKRKLGDSLEIGKEIAESSRGLFSPDDWQCTKCGNVNWARRQKCNICNVPKFTKQEERTGVGGGYNDRGVVEYVKREDSDEEFDRFGRRKRRRKENVEKSSEDSEQVKSESSSEEDDNDEDSDLSKYDLADWSDTKS